MSEGGGINRERTNFTEKVTRERGLRMERFRLGLSHDPHGGRKTENISKPRKTNL
jgi:hypothetical protein